MWWLTSDLDLQHKNDVILYKRVHKYFFDGPLIFLFTNETQDLEKEMYIQRKCYLN